MLRIYFENLSDSLKNGMMEFGKEYDFEVISSKDESNIAVKCEFVSDSILEVMRNDDNVVIRYCNETHIFRALGEVLRNISDKNYSSLETVFFDDICVMFDYSQGNQATKPKHLKKLILRFAAMGITSFMMYLEDGYEVEGEPYFGYMRPKYRFSDIKMLDDYAALFGIEIVPCMQTLGHLSNPLRWGVYNDIRDGNSTLLAGCDKTYELIRKMLVAASAPVRTKRIHIGMDEAWNLGLGQYIKKNGYQKASEIFKAHLNKVVGIARELGLEPMMWVDMFFRVALEEMGIISETFKTDMDINFSEEIIRNNPSLVYWDYHDNADQTDNMIRQCRKLSENLIVAGAIRNNRGFACKQAINDKNANTVLPICKKEGVRRIIATVWGDNCPEGSNYSALLGLQLYAEHGFAKEVDRKKLYNRFKFCLKCNPKAFEELRLFDEPCGITEPDTIANYNFSKYLLWQDPMLGLFDKNLEGLEMKKHYAVLAEKMHIYAEENQEYNKFFEFYSAAASALAEKSELGIRLHKAYFDGTLEKMTVEIESAIEAVRKLYSAHRDFWFTVNNPVGWEILDMRYGALLCRLETTALRIDDYLRGNIDEIPELEEKQLYYNGEKNMPQELEYPKIVSACNVGIIE